MAKPTLALSSGLSARKWTTAQFSKPSPIRTSRSRLPWIQRKRLLRWRLRRKLANEINRGHDFGMNAVWIKSKWTKADLDHKSVEFRFPIDPGIATGVGEFWVRENPEGLLSIEIVTDTQGKDWTKRIQNRFQIPQAGGDAIATHENPAVAQFLLSYTP